MCTHSSFGNYSAQTVFWHVSVLSQATNSGKLCIRPTLCRHRNRDGLAVLAGLEKLEEESRDPR